MPGFCLAHGRYTKSMHVFCFSLSLMALCMGALVLQSLEGHGQPINDIAVHPIHPDWVVTASKDNSLRLWNIKTKARRSGSLGQG